MRANVAMENEAGFVELGIVRATLAEKLPLTNWVVATFTDCLARGPEWVFTGYGSLTLKTEAPQRSESSSAIDVRFIAVVMRRELEWSESENWLLGKDYVIRGIRFALSEGISGPTSQETERVLNGSAGGLAMSGHPLLKAEVIELLAARETRVRGPQVNLAGEIRVWSNGNWVAKISKEGAVTRWSGIPAAMRAAFPFFEPVLVQYYNPESVMSHIDTWDCAPDASLYAILKQETLDAHRHAGDEPTEIWEGFHEDEVNRRSSDPERRDRYDNERVESDVFGHFLLVKFARTGVGDDVKVENWALVADMVPIPVGDAQSRRSYGSDREDMSICAAPNGVRYLITSFQDVYRMETWRDGTFDAFPRAWPGMDGPEFYRFGWDTSQIEARGHYSVELWDSCIIGNDSMMINGSASRNRQTIITWGVEEAGGTSPINRTRYEVQLPPGGKVAVLAVGRDTGSVNSPYWMFGYTLTKQEPHPYPNPRPDPWTLFPHLEWCVARVDPLARTTQIIPVKVSPNGALVLAQSMAMNGIDVELICTIQVDGPITRLTFFESHYDNMFEIEVNECEQK